MELYGLNGLSLPLTLERSTNAIKYRPCPRTRHSISFVAPFTTRSNRGLRARRANAIGSRRTATEHRRSDVSQTTDNVSRKHIILRLSFSCAHSDRSCRHACFVARPSRSRWLVTDSPTEAISGPSCAERGATTAVALPWTAIWACSTRYLQKIAASHRGPCSNLLTVNLSDMRTLRDLGQKSQ